MALSGSFGTNVGSYWRLQGEWSASQNAAANTSTITLRVYWMATQSGAGAIYSSSSKSGSSFIEGGGTQAFTATAGLSNGQKKLLDTHTRTVTHNADGTLPDVDMSISFTPDVSLSGSNPGTVTAAADFALNTIPRESTLTAAPSWTLGEILPLSVNRSSSSFRHEALLYVLSPEGLYGGAIKQIDFESSANVGFSTAEYEGLFGKLSGRATTGTRIILRTYNGSTLIGETTRDGTLTSPVASHPTTGYDSQQYISEAIDFPISRAMSSFTHTVRIKLGTYTKTVTGVGDYFSWTPTTTERNALASQMPGETDKLGSIEIDTFYNGVQVRTTTNYPIRLYVSGYPPIFNGTVSYRDTYTSTTALTGNSQYIVATASLVEVTLSAGAATAQAGATMEKYVFKLSGKTIERPYTSSAITVNFGSISAVTNQTLVVEAHDSRGEITAISKIVQVVPYRKPTVNLMASRVNGFEATTTIDGSGTYSTVKIGTTNRNDIMTVRYRTKPKTSSTWSGFSTLSVGTLNGSFSISEVTRELDSTQAFDVQMEVVDMLNTVSVTRTVSVGRPIWFIDDNLSSIAFNDFPKRANEFLLRGDLTGVSGMFFGGVSTPYGRGIHFMRSSTLVDSPTPSHYDNLYMYNGMLYMNANPVMDDTGMRYPTIKRETNGANILTQRVTTGHTDFMMIQSVTATASFATTGALIVDVTWPTSFSETPEWVVAQGVGSNSAHMVIGISNQTSTGCRLTMYRGASTTANFTTTVQVTASGRKP